MMSDVDAQQLAVAAAALAAAGAAVATQPADVRSRAEVEAVRETALSSFGAVHLVANNAGPGLSLYNASKFAVAGIMEAVGLELAEQRSPVTASVLCPWPVATKLAETSAGTTWADEVTGYLARSLAADDVGEMAMSQIVEGRFWLLSHPDLTFRLLDERLKAMKDGGRLFIPDSVWTED